MDPDDLTHAMILAIEQAGSPEEAADALAWLADQAEGGNGAGGEG